MIRQEDHRKLTADFLNDFSWPRRLQIRHLTFSSHPERHETWDGENSVTIWLDLVPALPPLKPARNPTKCPAIRCKEQALPPIARQMDRHDHYFQRASVLGSISFDNIGLALIILFGLLVVLAFGLVFYSPSSSRPRAIESDPERDPLVSSDRIASSP